MSTTTTPPAISFQNTLAYDIVVYDSFDDEPQTDDDSQTDADSNYFGTLTQLGTVAANSTGSIQPIHTTSTFILESATDSKPVKRCIKLGSKKTLLSFAVAQQDEDNMAKTFQFIDFILHNPNDPLATSFNALWKTTDSDLASDVDDFFAGQPAYSQCSFEDYMMAITYKAKHPDPSPDPAPVPETTYSLSQLIILMGGTWPSGLPDVIVSQFKCAFKDKQLSISMQVDITRLPFETPQIAQNIRSLFGDKKLTLELQVNFQFGLGIFGTRLTIDLADRIKIPTGSGHSLDISKPTVTFDINPLFKFVIFTLRGYIPFSIFSSKFNADISMVIDNEEAEIGVVIEGDNSSLPAPPIMKGVHFDQFGVGMGVFFEPPGYALGIQGKFHIGEPSGGNVIDLNDDTFVLVCKMEGDIPEPVYISFYVPQMDINKVLELFTDASPNLDVPVKFSDLSFRWAENPMEPIVLPDGSLSEMGYGFSANIDIFSFGFHGDVQIDLNNGLKADVEMSPLSLGNVFSMSGDGKGVTIKVDQNGNPIRNNEIRDKKVLQDALDKATDKQIVTAGGPVLIINTFSMPILHINAKASLFELMDFGIEADIDKDGIKFELDFGGVLTEKMVCNLSDFHNLYGSFTFGIDRNIPLPTIAGVSLGSIHVEAMASTHISIVTSLSDVILSIGGSFDFEGITRTFGDFSADIHIKTMTDAIEAIISNIAQFAEHIFDDFVNDAQKWANAAKDGLVQGYDTVSGVLKNAFSKTADEMSSIMKDAGYIADEIGAGLRDAFKADSIAVASILKNLGYSVNEVSDAIKNTWNCTLNDVAWAMQWVGYSATEVGSAVNHAFGTLAQEATNCLKNLSYTANELGNMIRDAFKGDSVMVASVMRAAGYAAGEIAGAIRNTWNCAVSDVVWAMQQVGYEVQEIGDAVKSAFGDVAQDLANAFNRFGIGAQQAADTVKNVFGKVINDTASILKQAGYAATDVASSLQNAFDVSVNEVGEAMKQVGYAAEDIAGAFESLGGDFEDLGNQIKNSKANPSNW